MILRVNYEDRRLASVDTFRRNAEVVMINLEYYIVERSPHVGYMDQPAQTSLHQAFYPLIAITCRATRWTVTVAKSLAFPIRNGTPIPYVLQVIAY